MGTGPVNPVAGAVIKRQSRQFKHLSNGISNLLGQGAANFQKQQIPAQGVKPFHFVLAVRRFQRLLSCTGGKMAGDDRRHHKGRKSHPVLGVRNRERSDGREKEEIKAKHAGNRSRQPFHQSPTRGNRQHRQQERKGHRHVVDTEDAEIEKRDSADDPQRAENADHLYQL